MKFKLIEKVMQERGEVQAQQKAFQDEYLTARDELTETKALYERTLTESVSAGQRPDDKALDALSDKISELTRKAERTGRAYEVTTHSLRPKTANDEVISAWNGEYLHQYTTQVIAPKIDAANAARDAYIDAVLAVREAEQAYETERMSVVFTLDPRNDLHNTVIYKLHKINPASAILLNSDDLHSINGGHRPAAYSTGGK
ncbi:hypothetical protein NSS79_02470 [Paenibacillus sp. FSL L8-0436]|uniref:hypothetical protein n=1 Tax=Paenibacillus sp. FSL L8-0436 TaxID=2954686 RepID=UPI003157FE57